MISFTKTMNNLWIAEDVDAGSIGEIYYDDADKCYCSIAFIDGSIIAVTEDLESAMDAFHA